MQAFVTQPDDEVDGDRPVSMRTILLTQGKSAIVDDADYGYVSEVKWHAAKNVVAGKEHWYAAAKIGGRTVRLHQYIMRPPAGMMVDHRNGNGLDNRRENLRVCTNQQNSANRAPRRDNPTGYKGVKFMGRRWRAQIGRTVLGLFDTPEAAAKAYDSAASSLYGEFARLNLPPEAA
jgi:hypothetical protein